MKAVVDLLTPEAAARVAAYRRSLDVALPGCVEAVVLFGSRARGDADEGSDYDLAVLLRGDMARRSDIRDKVADAAYEHVVAGYPFVPSALPDDYLRPVAGRYRTELARRIAREGALAP
jgi:predicted nucleotidyltransferase